MSVVQKKMLTILTTKMGLEVTRDTDLEVECSWSNTDGCARDRARRIGPSGRGGWLCGDGDGEE